MTTQEDECDCTTAKERLDAFRRGELDDVAVRELALHLKGCRHCHCIQQYEAAFLERLRHLGQSGCCPEQLRVRLGELLATPPGDG